MLKHCYLKSVLYVLIENVENSVEDANKKLKITSKIIYYLWEDIATVAPFSTWAGDHGLQRIKTEFEYCEKRICIGFLKFDWKFTK